MKNNFSFDTVRFVVPLPDEDKPGLCEKFLKTADHLYYDDSGELLKNHSRFRLMTPAEVMNKSSYDETITFHPSEQGILFEFSVPKFLYGHSSLLCWDFEQFFNDFRIALCAISHGYPFVPISEWILKRIDISYNFVMPDYNIVQDNLKYISNINIHGRASRYRSFPYWSFQNRTIKFYSKFDEMGKNKHHYFCDFDTVRLNSSKILRYEEEWRSPHLMRRINRKVFYNMKNFRITQRKQITFKLFMKSMESYSIEETLRGIFEEMTDRAKNVDSLTHLKLIRESFRNSKTYIDFYHLCLTRPPEKVKELVNSESTYYRKRKKLKDIGINVDYLYNTRESEENKIKPEGFDTKDLVNESDDEARFYNEMMKKYGLNQEELDRKAFIGSDLWKKYREEGA